ncbi:MAG: hypothetical protein WDM76_02350 [Limisphaerales bacterium]
MAILLSIPAAARAQDNPPSDQSTNDVSSDTLTNDVPTLKELMTSNNIVTNTVGIVLVKISPDLWAGKYEVTQTAYQKLTRSNPSEFRGPQNPVDSVSWNDAVDFCGKLSSSESKNCPKAGAIPFQPKRNG